jgi:hypothetical protein
MSNYNLNAEENQMLKYDYSHLNTLAETSKTNIAKATSVADLKSEICKFWSKIPDWAKKWLRNTPIVGKFFSIIADVLDSFCKG